jgi:hypothetical protein
LATTSHPEVTTYIKEVAPPPDFPSPPKFSKEFYDKAPKRDLDKLLEWQFELLYYKKAVERRLK